MVRISDDHTPQSDDLTLDDDHASHRHLPHGQPSPEEIRQACLQIQSEWSESERKRRSSFKPVPYRLREVRLNVDFG